MLALMWWSRGGCWHCALPADRSSSETNWTGAKGTQISRPEQANRRQHSSASICPPLADTMNAHNHAPAYPYAQGATPHDTASIANGHAAAPAAPAAAAADGGDGDSLIQTRLAEVMASTVETYQMKMRMFNGIMKMIQVPEQETEAAAATTATASSAPVAVAVRLTDHAAHIPLCLPSASFSVRLVASAEPHGGRLSADLSAAAHCQLRGIELGHVSRTGSGSSSECRADSRRGERRSDSRYGERITASMAS